MSGFDNLHYTMYSTVIMTTTKSSVGCIKAATEILGDKWTPLLLRYFINEDRVHFCKLQDSARGINPRTLSARLDRLEDEGVILKISTSPSRCEYSLTSKGRDLLPIIVSMESWSRKYA